MHLALYPRCILYSTHVASWIIPAVAFDGATTAGTRARSTRCSGGRATTSRCSPRRRTARSARGARSLRGLLIVLTARLLPTANRATPCPRLHGTARLGSPAQVWARAGLPPLKSAQGSTQSTPSPLSPLSRITATGDSRFQGHPQVGLAPLPRPVQRVGGADGVRRPHVRAGTR